MADFVISLVDDNKEIYMPLLLIGDESEKMINRYLDRCTLYVGILNRIVIAVCAVTEESHDIIEVKNLAVAPDFRRKGYGRKMLEYVEQACVEKTIYIGTGETPSNLAFYNACGFKYSHRISNFFSDNYPYPIIEEGIELCDMVYLKKKRDID